MHYTLQLAAHPLCPVGTLHDQPPSAASWSKSYAGAPNGPKGLPWPKIQTAVPNCHQGHARLLSTARPETKRNKRLSAWIFYKGLAMSPLCPTHEPCTSLGANAVSAEFRSVAATVKGRREAVHVPSRLRDALTQAPASSKPVPSAVEVHQGVVQRIQQGACISECPRTGAAYGMPVVFSLIVATRNVMSTLQPMMPSQLAALGAGLACHLLHVAAGACSCLW